MPVAVSAYLNRRRLLTGRASYALRQIHKTASEEREPGLRRRIERAREQAKRTLLLEREWDNVKSNRTRARGNAAEIDLEFDEAWRATERAVRGQLIGDATDPARAAATKLIDRVFPLGTAGITQQPFEIQLEKSDAVLDLLESDKLAPHVRTLHLERHVAALRDISRRFRIELEKEPKALTWNEVVAEQNRTHELYSGVLIDVLDRYSDPDDEDGITRREELLAEPNRQDAAMYEFYRRQRKPLDVDPETGAVVETEAAELADGSSNG